MPHPLQMRPHRLLPQRELLQHQATSSFLLQTQHAPRMVPPPPPPPPLPLSLPLPSLQKGVQSRNHHPPNPLSGSREKTFGWMRQTGSVDGVQHRKVLQLMRNTAAVVSFLLCWGHNNGVQLVLQACLVKFEFSSWFFNLINYYCLFASSHTIDSPYVRLLRSPESTYIHIAMPEKKTADTVEAPSASKRGRGAKTAGGKPAKASSKKVKPSPSNSNSRSKEGGTRKNVACEDTPTQRRACTLDAWIVRDPPTPTPGRSALRSLSPDAAVIREGLLTTSPNNSKKSREDQVSLSGAVSFGL